LARRAPIALLAAICLAGGVLWLHPGAGRAEVVRKGDLIVRFGGAVAPRALPRTGTVPVGVGVEGLVRSAAHRLPPSLRRISLEINRAGVLDTRGLPVCRLSRLQATDTAGALAACGDARVGSGRIEGQVSIADQIPFPFDGRLVAFNGRTTGGHPAILAHLYAPDPVPLTFVIAFRVERIPGTFGTRLVAIVPRRTRRLNHVTRFSLHLRRTYLYEGKRHSYLSAGCPAPPGFPGATFPLLRANYRFDDGTSLTSTVVRTCKVR
jgi:hypothetical protein